MILAALPSAALSLSLLSDTLVSEANAAADAYFRRDPVGFGVGIVLGLPTGLSLAWKKANTPVFFDAALAWSLDSGAFLVQGDILIVPTTLRTADWSDLAFPLYVGVGPRIAVNDDYDHGSRSDGSLGVRVPLGMAFQHDNFPLEGFLEVAPGLRLFPSTSFFFDVACGARFYFG